MSGRFDLTGKIALVTGGTRGIGLAIARALRECGATVAVADIAERDIDGELTFLRCDLRRPEQITAMMAEVGAIFGRLDVLVNNAAIGLKKPALETSVEEWEEVLRINVTAPFLLCCEAAKLMRRQKRGRIINFGSNFGSVGVSEFAAYSVSKAAVIQLSRSLAVEWARDGITVNTISPSATRTERTRERLDDPALTAHYERLFPVGRVLEVEDLVGAAIFLASDASSMVTGHNLNVDGGYLSRGEF